jgi:N-acyl-L-homoserine lactone synthetase
MIHIVDRYNREVYASLLMEMHRYRHDVYIKERKWAALRSYDDMEIDEYDGANATYLIATDETGKFQGSVRLVSTAHTSMMKDHFSDIVFDVDTIPQSDCIMEIHRTLTVDSNHRDQNNNSVFERLYVAMVEYTLSQGAIALSSVTDKDLVDKMDELEWRYIPLSDIEPYGEGEGAGLCMAQYMPICPLMLKHIDRNAKIGESNFVIGDDWAKANLNPSDFLAETYEKPPMVRPQALAG